MAIYKMIEAHPTWSDRQISAQCQLEGIPASHPTVGAVRRLFFGHQDRREGADGITRRLPTKKPRETVTGTRFIAAAKELAQMASLLDFPSLTKPEKKAVQHSLRGLKKPFALR